MYVRLVPPPFQYLAQVHTFAVTYLTGILNDNELHLTEVKGVLSVRPNLTYLDKSDRRAKQEGGGRRFCT